MDRIDHRFAQEPLWLYACTKVRLPTQSGPAMDLRPLHLSAEIEGLPGSICGSSPDPEPTGFAASSRGSPDPRNSAKTSLHPARDASVHRKTPVAADD